ncbi:hypothetical protein [Mycobacteroides abscessus]|uniref:Bacteriophage gp78 domain protein n=2 Tax=Mycobacteroides abscessus TaxID=36809 RepID=A0A829MB87_9MYCO|nr:hypothetical protein [Mycobacteroides abscessus]ESV58903.1 bacteriophage gp78 domain protein [Mycobacteroides abscessus MAB_082312_2258]ESV62287.1 bacteriophage gp78 domain protein [Mycobacteroides abscessus MAB_091912_2446]QSM04449.1 hypothetical protein PROPHIGD02-2_47 [Mycobacterium phage prophiGD02-2]QST87317.1 hypothetical protein PROPHIGD90-1_47 [Mycobacterium phage prophiGD90-1]AWG57392.1 hypothetical protein DDT53_16000 [Mycobacteroides abscessus]
MSELVDRAKASLEGVTPGPWEISDQDDGTASVWSDGRIIFADESGFRGGFAALPDAEFIAAARQLVPELIEAVEFLEQAADHWKSLWQGTVEDSTKVIQERDEALREVEALKNRAIPETVTRIDMIDPKRQEHWSDYWSVSIQDEGRTLKLFAEGDGSTAREERDAALAKTISEDLRRLGGTDE